MAPNDIPEAEAAIIDREIERLVKAISSGEASESDYQSLKIAMSKRAQLRIPRVLRERGKRQLVAS